MWSVGFTLIFNRTLVNLSDLKVDNNSTKVLCAGFPLQKLYAIPD